MKAREVNSCGGGADLLAGFRGELSPSEAESLDIHLASCPVCTKEDAGIRALAAALDDLPTIEPSRGSWLNMRSRLESMIEEDTLAPVSRRRILPAVLAAGLAAAALLIAFLLPSSPAATVSPLAGDIAVNGSPLGDGADSVKLFKGAVIAATTLSRISLSSSRETDLTLAPDTRLVVESDETLRLERGRILAKVSKGEEPIAFRAAGELVVVTGTWFDLEVGGLKNQQATVTVFEGEVEVRAGRGSEGTRPARVVHGMAYSFPAGPGSIGPVPADPWRVRDWCSAPTPRLTLTDHLLTLSLENRTVSTLRLKPFDPATASYFLHLDGPAGRMDVKVQKAMVVKGGRRAGEPEIRTLAPGETLELTIDLGGIDLRALGVSAGTYEVTVHYRPYPPLPADAWRGRLVAGPVTLRVD